MAFRTLSHPNPTSSTSLSLLPPPPPRLPPSNPGELSIQYNCLLEQQKSSGLLPYFILYINKTTLHIHLYRPIQYSHCVEASSVSLPLRKRKYPTARPASLSTLPPLTPTFRLSFRTHTRKKRVIMCNYTQVEYECGHRRYTVRAWCTNYETTHRRCPPTVVAVQWRLDERCGDCREPAMQPWMKYQTKNTRIQT
ncbi:hypothetical protein ONS95_005766 [Cadophora gregata]|uniref:uncharacterized protein n=1 Tax=Cadophora gregata TaxID=51156 RepID=UPI0026DAFA8D|nr:uncharacterized protein ONS95_005766 [Cadophora gregata]KAK0103763.1 hypothetical protein ONS95_005766 [Cadophora gregata]